MKSATLNRTPLFLAFGLPALIIATAISIASSSLITAYPELAIAITYDLTISAPLFYLFFIRKTNISKKTAMPFFVLGIVLATFLVPVEQQFHLSLIKYWIFPIVELFVFGYIAWKVYKTVKFYQSAKKENSDILNILQETCQKVLGIPILANAVAFEMSVIYYGFFKWRKPTFDKNSFTYHQKSGKVAVFGAIIFIVAVETLVIHFLIAQWNEIVAWVLTLASVYVLLQIFAHLKAIYQRPIEISDDKLFIRYGLFGGVEIDLENIENIELTSVKPSEKEGVKQIALLGELEYFNTKIQLKNEAEFAGFYGVKNKFKTLLLFVDDNERFKQSIKITDHLVTK